MNYPNPQYTPQAPYPPQAPAQPQYPSYPPQQQPPAYPPQAQYPAGPQQPPAAPLAQGTIDDYYGQPSAGGGPSISWTDKQGSPKPLGTTYAGIVARDVTNSDIQQQTDFKTKAPLFYRDGRPKFAMKVPLKVQPSEEFPEGEATWYVKGQARDELVRAMSEAGADSAPKAGAAIAITLVQRKPIGQGMNPANIVQVQYQPPVGATVPSQAPEQPVQQQVQQPAQQVPVVQAAQPPVPAQPATPQGPADFNAEQQALLARLSGQNPAA